jgi:outer membrane protein TolC
MKYRWPVLGFFLMHSFFMFAQPGKLDYYINQGLLYSPLLKDYANQQQLNQLDSLRIRAGYKPQIMGNSFNSYAPSYKGWGYDGVITNGGNFTALVGVNKAIVNKKLIAAQFETLQLQSQAAGNSAKISEQDLKRNIISQYITAYGDLQQLNFNREVITLLTNEEIILKKLTEKNVYRQVDYLAFLVTLQQQHLLIQQLDNQFKADQATLNYLCGINDTSGIALEAPGLVLGQLPYAPGSVFFKQYEIDSLKLVNSKTLVAVSYKPRFNLFADAGFNSSFSYQGYKNFGTSFGISAVVPIYDGNQKKIQFQKLAIEESNRLNYKSFFSSQYTQQINQLLQQLHSTEKLIDEINGQLKYAESLINVNGKLIETGEARIADYILSVNALLNVKNLITQNNINRLQIINQINYWNR